MSAGPKIKIADAYFALGVDGDIAEAISGPMNRLEMVGGALMKAGATLLAVWGSVGAGLAYATDVAGRHMQQIQRMTMIYDNLAESQLNWIDEYTKATKRAEVQTTQIMGRASSLFKGYGFDERATAQLSRQLTEMIGDYQALIGLPMEETLQRVMSGMTGSGEAMERLSTNMKQAELDKVMKDMFGMTTGQGATEMMKVLARLIIMQETLKKQGGLGFDKYANTYPKALAITQSSLTDLVAAIGEALVPTAMEALGVVYKFVKALTVMTEKNPWLIKGFVIMAAAISAVGVALLTTGAAFVGLTMIVTTLAPVIMAALHAINTATLPLLVVAAAAAVLASGLVAIGAAFAYTSMEARASGDAIRQYLANLASAFDKNDVEQMFINIMAMLDTFQARVAVILKKIAVYAAEVTANVIIGIFAGVMKAITSMMATAANEMLKFARKFSPMLNFVPDMDAGKINKKLDALANEYRGKAGKAADNINKQIDEDFKEFEQKSKRLSEALALMAGNANDAKDSTLDAMSQQELIDYVKSQLGGAGAGGTSLSPIKAVDYRTVSGQEAARANQLSLFNLLERAFANQQTNTEANKATAAAVTQPRQPTLAGV